MPTIPWGYSATSTISMEDGVALANYLYTDTIPSEVIGMIGERLADVDKYDEGIWGGSA